MRLGERWIVIDSSLYAKGEANSTVIIDNASIHDRDEVEILIVETGAILLYSPVLVLYWKNGKDEGSWDRCC
jgi:hypothetical protein